MKLMVVTSAFQAGAIVDDDTHIVRETDHWLAHLRGMTEDKFREHCRQQGWPVGVVAD